MCREAVASGHASFSDGLNRSILFMLAMVIALPAGFGLLVWRSYRVDAARSRSGSGYAPEGRVRWEGDGPAAGGGDPEPSD